MAREHLSSSFDEAGRANAQSKQLLQEHLFPLRPDFHRGLANQSLMLSAGEVSCSLKWSDCQASRANIRRRECSAEDPFLPTHIVQSTPVLTIGLPYRLLS